MTQFDIPHVNIGDHKLENTVFAKECLTDKFSHPAIVL